MNKDDKKEIRRKLINIRSSLDKTEISRLSKLITDRIIGSEEYRESKCIYAYIAFRGEVELFELINNALKNGKRVAVPKVYGKDMVFRYIEDFSNLETGSFGIMEPADFLKEADDEEALLLIPGVAYDLECNRIGYGGGFYDRYLSVHSHHRLIAPAYDFQVFDSIPHEEFDMGVDVIVSESRILFRRGKNE